MAVIVTGMSAYADDFKMTYTSRSELKELASKHMKFVGPSGSLKDYKKMVVPTYMITLNTLEQKVGSHGLAARLAGIKSALTLTVKIDPKPLEGILKEATDESHARFKKKLAAFGYTIEDEKEAQKNEDVAEWFKDEIKASPAIEDKKIVVGSQGTYDGLKGCGFTRDIQAACQIPNFVVSVGTFVDEAGPGTIKASHEGVDLFFQPEFKIQDMKMILNGKYVMGRVEMKNPMTSLSAISGTSEKTGDNSASRSNTSAVGLQFRKDMGRESSTQMFSYSEAGKSFEFNPNPKEFKVALMAELDKIEDVVLEKYFEELD